MKTLIYFISLLIGFLFSKELNAQATSLFLKNENVTCHYTVVNGRITGHYSSVYINGVKKCEGQLINGYRKGKWTVWDSTGRKRMERFYKNQLEFDRIFPPVSTEGSIPLLASNPYPMQYDSNRLIKYAKIAVDDAIWRHKYWRTLTPKDNSTLFDNNKLLEIICDLVKQERINVYSTIDDRFTTVIKMDTFDIAQAEFIGLAIKEEGTFDLNRLLFEYRVLGLSPVVRYKGYEGTLFWVYYPDIRKYLARHTILSDNPFIKTLDDLFIFRDFASTITKTTMNNPMDLPFSQYPNFTKADEINQATIEELNVIEQENNLWMYFALPQVK